MSITNDPIPCFNTELFTYDYVSEQIKEAYHPCIMINTLHSYQVVWVSFSQRHGRMTAATLGTRDSAEQLHLPFFPRELDQWVRSLNSTLTRLLHHKQEVLHHHQHHNNAVQLLAYAHRAVSRHDDYYSEWHKILPAALNNINTKNIRRDSWDYLTLNGDKSRHVSTFASCF